MLINLEQVKKAGRREIEQAMELLRSLDDSLSIREKALEQYVLLNQPRPASAETPPGLELPPRKERRNRSRRGRKPNTRVYEEIILAKNKPLHADDIADDAEARGIVLRGKLPKARQIRNALSSSPKRFRNVGGNTWWLVDRPIPGEVKVSQLGPVQPRIDPPSMKASGEKLATSMPMATALASPKEIVAEIKRRGISLVGILPDGQIQINLDLQGVTWESLPSWLRLAYDDNLSQIKKILPSVGLPRLPIPPAATRMAEAPNGSNGVSGRQWESVGLRTPPA